MNLAVGEVLLQQFHHVPPVNESLQFGGRAQVFEEIAALIDRFERYDGREQGVLGRVLLAFGFVSIGLNGSTNVLMR